MAVNVLGQTVQLALNQTQLQDFSQNLKPGEQFRGRVVEVMQDGKAVVNFKGFQILAELSPALFQAVQKGDVLQVQVSRIDPAVSKQNQAGTAATEENTPPPIQLKLVALLNSGAATQPNLAGATNTTAQQSATAQAKIESAIRQAGLPVNENTLAVARALADNGLPVSTGQIRSVLDIAANLAKTPMPVANSDPATSQAFKSLPFEIQQAVNTARTILNALSLTNTSTQSHLQLQQGLRLINAVSQNNPAGKGSQTTLSGQATTLSTTSATETQVQAVPGTPSPAPSAAPAPAQTASATQPGAPAAPAPAPVSTPVPTLLQLAGQLQQAATSFQANPTQSYESLPAIIVGLQQLQQGIQQGLAPGTSAPATPPANTSAPGAPTAPLPAQPAQPALPPQTLHGIVFREAVAILTARLAPGPDQPVFNPTLSQQTAVLASSLSLESSVDSKLLLNQVNTALAQAGLPQAPAEQIMAQARQSLALVQETFGNLPLARPLMDPAALAGALQARGFEMNPDPLQSAPRTVLLEAIVFLRARELPVTPALVRPVVQAFAQGESLGARLETILQAIPNPVNQANAEAKPPLPQAVQQALQEIGRFMQQQGVRPGDPGVATQIREFVFNSGLNLESRLANTVTEQGNPTAKSDAPIPQPSNDLKAGLLRLQTEVQQALAKPETAQSKSYAHLLSVERNVGQALASLTTLQLSAVPLPSFDTLAIQIPMWFGGSMESGHVSVYWKKGGSGTPQLSDKDPINMVFSLNTRGLGEVKVLLQVWKNECNCSVKVQDADTQAFFEPFLAELKNGFDENTPFKMTDLNIGLHDANLGLFATGPAAASPVGRLNISA